jgi:hypothetical protein
LNCSHKGLGKIIGGFTPYRFGFGLMQSKVIDWDQQIVVENFTIIRQFDNLLR